jgi:CRP-like cAMP-binding protein
MFKQLEAVPLFRDIDNHILNLLEPLFEPFSCPGGAVIFEQGEPALYLYLILHGSVEMIYKPYDGPQITITYLAQGSIIGWSAVVGNATYTSGAICKQEVQAIRMTGRDLLKLCKEQPEAGRVILNRLADSVSSRWQDAREQIQILLNSSVNARREQNAQKRRRNIRKEH